MALAVSYLTARWGKIFGGINEANSFLGPTVQSRADALLAKFPTVSAQAEVVEDMVEEATSLRTTGAQWTEYLRGLATATIQTMCRDDTVRPTTDDVPGWFAKLKRDMISGSFVYQRPVVSDAVTLPGTNIGDGYLITSTTDPVDGVSTYYAYGEVVRIECVRDAYSNETSTGAESFTVQGETSVTTSAYNWPKGSGANTTYQAYTPDGSGLLVDGDLELWGGTGNNTPTDWSLFGSTTAGTHLFRGTTSPYAGTYYAKFTGDGATVVGIYQALDLDKMKPSTNYAVQFWYQTDNAVFTAKLRVAFTDGSGTVITDNAGTSQSNSSVDETALGAANGTWTRAGFVLRTPRNMPTELRLEFRFPSGDVLDNAKSVYIDWVNLVEMTPIYDGGPHIAIIAGATAFAKRDAFTETVSQASGSGSIVRNLDRFFGLATQGIRLQAEASWNLGDSLIS